MEVELNRKRPRWDQVMGNAIHRLDRAGCDVRELRKQYFAIRGEVLQFHRKRRKNDLLRRRAWGFEVPPYRRIRDLGDSALLELRFPIYMSGEVREFMCRVASKLVEHGLVKHERRVRREIFRVQTTWLPST